MTTKNPQLKKLIDYLLIGLLFGISVLFFWDCFEWMFEKFKFGLFKPLNVLVALALIAISYNKIKSRKTKLFKIQQNIVFPFVLMFLALVSYTILEYLYGIRTFKSVFLLLYLFGLLGCFMRIDLWLKSIVPFLVLAILLPYGGLLDTYIGFPLRLKTAAGVEKILSLFHFETIGEQTILGLENKYTQIDTSCSGLNLIWSGSLIFIAYSIIEELAFGLRWMGILIAYLSSLIVFNFIRISTLVSLELVFDLETLANAIHIPLGVIGFIIPTIGLYFLLRSHKRKESKILDFISRRNRKLSYVQNYSLKFTVLGLLLLGSFVNQRIEAKEFTTEHTVVEYIDSSFCESIPLSKLEQSYYAIENSKAGKYKFEYKSISGSFIVVKSNSFKGHHNPENCLRASGHKIAKNKPVLLNSNPARKLTFKNNKHHAYFWFRNNELFTDDYSYRVWYDLKNTNRSNDWLQVTLLINDKYNQVDLEEFYIYINKQLDTEFYEAT